jgi:hypothetical protein
MTMSRPFASLSSGLLARKGAAKPAMRPQGFGQFGASLEDLGWNDMGSAPVAAPEPEDFPEHVPSSIAALTPLPHNGRPVADEPAAPPPVVEQQRAIAESFAPAAPAPAPAPEPEPEPEPVPAPEPEPVAEAAPAPAAVVSLPRRRAAPAAAGRKAAFTLRLDPDRHMRLRLASAVTARSAQQIVTEALDTFLSTLPELDELARRVPASGGKRS